MLFPAGTGIQDSPAACVTRDAEGVVLGTQGRHEAGHEGSSETSDLYQVEQLVWLDFLPILGSCDC
jgi:hypothetical protein